MKIQDVIKREKKEVVISIRTTKEISKWMKDKNISPNAVFEKAIASLKEE